MHLLASGEIINIKNYGDVKVLQYLGEGVTSEVFKAQVLKRQTDEFAALKVLRPGSPERIRSNFWREMDILGELTRSEAISDLIPRFRGHNEERGIIVIEYVTGIPLDRLLEKSGTLDESQAVKISVKFLGILKVLHETLGRTYTDLQLQNIWWQEERQSIKVMDWNTVSDHFDPSDPEFDRYVDQDLLRYGTYLYKMVTGKAASQSGETPHTLAGRAGERWEKISLKLRGILEKSISPKREKRYQAADPFFTDLEQLSKYWALGVEDVVDLFASELDPAEIPDLASLSDAEEVQQILVGKSSQLREAQELYNLIVLRNGDLSRVADADNRLRQYLDKADEDPLWVSGYRYFRAKQYRQADAIWQPLAAETQKPLHFRWARAAQFAGAYPHEEQAIQIVEDYLAHFAGQRFLSNPLAGLDTTLIQASTPLAVLAIEAAILVKYHSAQNTRQTLPGLAMQEKEAAVAALVEDYRFIAQNLVRIPWNAQLALDYDFPQDFTKAAQNLEDEAASMRTLGKKIAQVKNLIHSDYQQGIEMLESFLKDYSSEPAAMTLVKDLLPAVTDGEHEYPVIELALNYLPLTQLEDEEFRAQYRVGAENARKKAATARQTELQEQFEASLRKKDWRKVRANLAELEPERARGFKSNLQGEYRGAVTEKNLPLARELKTILDYIDPEDSQKREDEITKLDNAARQQTKGWSEQIVTNLKQSITSGAITSGDAAQTLELINLLLTFPKAHDLNQEQVGTLETTRQGVAQRALRQYLQQAEEELARLSQENLTQARQYLEQARNLISKYDAENTEQSRIEALESVIRNLEKKGLIEEWGDLMVLPTDLGSIPRGRYDALRGRYDAFRDQLSEVIPANPHLRKLIDQRLQDFETRYNLDSKKTVPGIEDQRQFPGGSIRELNRFPWWNSLLSLGMFIIVIGAVATGWYITREIGSINSRYAEIAAIVTKYPANTPVAISFDNPEIDAAATTAAQNATATADAVTATAAAQNAAAMADAAFLIATQTAQAMVRDAPSGLDITPLPLLAAEDVAYNADVPRLELKYDESWRLDFQPEEGGFSAACGEGLFYHAESGEQGYRLVVQVNGMDSNGQVIEKTIANGHLCFDESAATPYYFWQPGGGRAERLAVGEYTLQASLRSDTDPIQHLVGEEIDFTVNLDLDAWEAQAGELVTTQQAKAGKILFYEIPYGHRDANFNYPWSLLAGSSAKGLDFTGGLITIYGHYRLDDGGDHLFWLVALGQQGEESRAVYWFFVIGSDGKVFNLMSEPTPPDTFDLTPLTTPG